MTARLSKNTRLAILDSAESLILTRGYNGFSYKDIADTVGIRKASIHHHFATKEALGAAFVDRYAERFAQWRERVADLSVAQKLAALLEMFEHVSDNAERICPLGMLTAEYPTLPLAVRDRLRKLLAAMDGWLVQVLARGQTEGCLRRVPEAPVMAKVVLNALSLSLQTARVFQDVDQLKQVFNALICMIDLQDTAGDSGGQSMVVRK